VRTVRVTDDVTSAPAERRHERRGIAGDLCVFAVAELTRVALPALRAARGIVVPINMLVDQATAAVKEGLPRQTALEALTTNPAEFLGFGDRVGSLAEGYDADLVLWDGDPLDATSRATRVWIDGKSVFAWADGTGVTTPRW
ncbi:amidohydrolase family protein, partial [Bacillus sp. S34]|nr:amidohydrolase family protein [Bacillus sp. S34]